jgi:exonuclease SbcC
MIPVRLQLQGFLSYNEKADLDFRAVDLACISGSNGAGKSSLLDAITWVLFGEARRRDDSVINHQAGAAEVILDFLYENSLYRVQRSKKKNETTRLDFFIQDAEESWRPLTEATLRATEERIRQSLKLDYETFTNASFFLQGKADQFAQQRPGDRKRILSSILGLDLWEKYREETARRRRLAEQDLAAVEGQVKEIDAELAEEEARRQHLEELQGKLKVSSELAEARKALLDQQRVVAERIQGERKQVEKQQAEIQRLQQELDSRVESLRQRQEERKSILLTLQNERMIRQGNADWQKVKAQLEAIEKVAANFHQFQELRQAPLLVIEKERTLLQAERDSLTVRKTEMEALRGSLPALNLALDELARTVKNDNDQLEMRPVLENDLRDLAAERGRVKAENTILKKEMDELKERITTLQQATGATCPTCDKPLNSAERHRMVDALTAQGNEKGNKYRENLQVADHCDVAYREKETQMQSLQRIEAELKLHQRLFDQKSEEIRVADETLKNWEQAGELRLAELEKRLANSEYAPEAQEKLEKIDRELRELGYDPAVHAQLRQQETELRTNQDALTALENARAALTPLEQNIHELEDSIDRSEEHLKLVQTEYQESSQKLGEIGASAPELDVLESDYFSAQEQANMLLTEVGSARSQVEVLAKQKLNKTSRLEEKEFIKGNIASFKMLEKAFSKDGIPSLLIEQALPEIESHANEILDRLSSGTMSVHFETQRQYRDRNREDRKETLDILIRDAMGEREYELFSGGEAFRINFAIRLALSRVLSHRAGARLQTLVIDEGFGSQDADGRQRLIEAINLVRGDFAKILVITHLEELKDAFPARIEVVKANTGSKVSVVAG